MRWMMFMRILMVTIQTEKEVLIMFDDMIADIMNKNKLEALIKELSIRCRKLNISLFYHSILLSCSKKCQIKYKTLFDFENQQQKRITKYYN